MSMNSAISTQAEKDIHLRALVNELVASLPNPHAIVMRIEIGDRHGNDTLYLIDTDGNPLNYAKSGKNKIWQHFYDWRKPTENAPESWNLAVLRWSAAAGVTVEYGHTDVEDVGNSRNRRRLWEQQEFGDGEMPFFSESREKRPQ
jgi:hypothetical protein